MLFVPPSSDQDSLKVCTPQGLLFVVFHYTTYQPLSYCALQYLRIPLAISKYLLHCMYLPRDAIQSNTIQYHLIPRRYCTLSIHNRHITWNSTHIIILHNKNDTIQKILGVTRWEAEQGWVHWNLSQAIHKAVSVHSRSLRPELTNSSSAQRQFKDDIDRLRRRQWFRYVLAVCTVLYCMSHVWSLHWHCYNIVFLALYCSITMPNSRLFILPSIFILRAVCSWIGKTTFLNDVHKSHKCKRCCPLLSTSGMRVLLLKCIGHWSLTW